MDGSLVQPLFDGEIDIIGDVHGDKEALHRLLSHLGYSVSGIHPRNRRLVFVGDLVDRGPDSPGVVRLVRQLVESERAQCVLGNHELNLLLGRRKTDNVWFFGAEESDRESTGEFIFDGDEDADDEQEPSPQTQSLRSMREELKRFFRALPLALIGEQVRVVHACWQPEMVDIASGSNDVLELYRRNKLSIEVGLAIRSDLTTVQRKLRLQNLNPVSVLTSGLEVAVEPASSGSALGTGTRRYPWWKDYGDEEFCFFGHYSLAEQNQERGNTRARCIDFGVGKRWVEKRTGMASGTDWKLAAVRFPERIIVFENGETRDLVPG